MLANPRQQHVEGAAIIFQQFDQEPVCLFRIHAQFVTVKTQEDVGRKERNAFIPVHKRVIHDEGLGHLDPTKLAAVMESPYFIPEGTALHKQLVQFQQNRKRAALVVDEYGDIQGLVTLEDILEEIVGEFTTDIAPTHNDVTPDKGNSSYLVNASANIRSLNRMMNWDLPTDGAKTLNGVILEHLETIPETGTGLRLGDYPIEIVQTSDNVVNLVRIHSPDEKTASSTAA